MNINGNPLFTLLHIYGRAYRVRIGVGLVLHALGRFAQMAPGLVIGIAIDSIFDPTVTYELPLVPQSVVPEEAGGQLVFTTLLIGGAYFTDATLDFVADRIYMPPLYEMQHDARVELYDRAQSTDLSFFDEVERGQAMSILNNDVNTAMYFLRSGISPTVRFSVLLVAIFAYMFLLSWQLALLMVVVPALITLIVLRFTAVVEENYETLRKNIGRLNSEIERNLKGIDVIKTRPATDTELEDIEERSEVYLDNKLQVASARGLMHAALNLVTGVGRALVLVVGAYWILTGSLFVIEGTITPGALITFLIYVGDFSGPIRQLTGVADSYKEASAAAERVLRLRSRTDDPGEYSEDETRTPTDLGEVGIVVDSVSFGYREDEQVLQDVYLNVDPGETIGIVGPTGSGKSTLLKLVMGFYTPDSGEVRVGSVSTESDHVRGVRRQFGYVSQEPHLFEGTIAENVAYTEANPDVDRVRDAAKTAGVDEFVSELDEGYDTHVNETANNFSGGQRQRLSIARALYGRPQALALDEPLSHVDRETEAVVRERLSTVTRDRITLVVAHRLSVVRNADRIVVLEDGQVQERGTHDELVSADGTYARLWRAQVGEATPDEPVVEEVGEDD